MKIVHVGSYSKIPTEGVGRTILEQTRALAEGGSAIELWNLTTECLSPEFHDVGERYPLWKVPISRSSLRKYFSLPKITHDWILSRKSEIDIVHLHSVFTVENCHIARICARERIPYVVTPNGGWSNLVLQGRRRFLKMLWIELFEKRLWSQANCVQGVTLQEIKQISGRKGMAPLRLIPNGTHIPQQCSKLGDRDCILYMGRYAIEHKGLDVLFQALLILSGRNVTLPKIILAGADHRDGRRLLESFVAKHQMEAIVEFRGPVQGAEKEDLFRRAKIFIHTSRWEGLPLVLLEAISHGIPCVLTPGTNVASEWAGAGCAFEVRLDAQKIADVLEEVTKSDLSAASAAARNLAVAEYSWENVANKLLEMYRDVASF